MKTASKQYSFQLFTLATLVVSAYWGIWGIYFQQDEWSGFARGLIAEEEGIGSLIRFSGSHFTPFTVNTFIFWYNIFGLHSAWYAVFAITLHFVNTYLLFVLAKKMFSSFSTAIFAAAIFAVNATSQQAVTWYAASFSFVPAATLALLGLIYFESFLSSQKSKYIILSGLFIILSAGFRENSIALLGYIVLRLMLVQQWKPIRFLVGIGGVYMAGRFLPLILDIVPKTIAHASSFSFFHIILQNIRFIFFYLPRIIIPPDVPAFFIKSVFGNYEQYLSGEIYLGIFYVLLAMILFFLIKKHRTPDTTFWVLIGFLVFSIVPFSLLPIELSLESRHFYLSSVGWALLCGWGYKTIFSRHTKKSFYLAGLCAIYIFLNVFIIQKEIARQNRVSRERQKIVSELSVLYPTLPKKSLIYATGSALPFQSGVGHMLMVIWHAKQNYIPLLTKQTLWDMDSQGYYSARDVGLGYIRDWNLLISTYCKEHFLPEQVFSFSWDGVEILNTSLYTRSLLSCTL